MSAVIFGLCGAALLAVIAFLARRSRLLAAATLPDWGVGELELVATPPDPLTRELSPVELSEALLFEEIAAAYPVRLDWRPPDFTSEWEILGERLAELGDTQQMQAVPA
jgi:hypothetical protein